MERYNELNALALAGVLEAVWKIENKRINHQGTKTHSFELCL